MPVLVRSQRLNEARSDLLRRHFRSNGPDDPPSTTHGETSASSMGSRRSSSNIMNVNRKPITVQRMAVEVVDDALALQSSIQ